MARKLEPETLLGGIAASIAVIAIFFEIAYNSFTPAAIAAGIKDFSTTCVAILVLIVAVRKLKPKKVKETFDSVLQTELDDWVKRSDPLVQRAQDYSESIRYYMITDLDKVLYADNESIEEIRRKGSVNSGTFNGKFVDLPSEAIPTLRFYLNASTFKERAKAKNKSYEDTLEKLAPAIANCISKNFNDMCEAGHSKDGKTIMVTFKYELYTPDHARELVKLIDYVMTLYTIAS